MRVCSKEIYSKGKAFIDSRVAIAMKVNSTLAIWKARGRRFTTMEEFMMGAGSMTRKKALEWNKPQKENDTKDTSKMTDETVSVNSDSTVA